MKLALFYHSLLSDWNHSTAHFLRGITWELLARGHDVLVFEPADSWSLRHLLSQYGDSPLQRFYQMYPGLHSHRYYLDTLNLDAALEEVDMVLVHGWNDSELVRRIGRHHSSHGNYRLFFHDTHHRLITDPESLHEFDLSAYDGVLAHGNVLCEAYEQSGRVNQAWTWHEAADTRLFRPLSQIERQGDLIWLGNWGDDARHADLNEYLIGPCAELSLQARAHGVRYPAAAVDQLAAAGIDYAGWLPNFDVPRTVAAFGVTIHVPGKIHTQALPGVPTLHVFEALACGIPLVCAPWDDTERLFEPGNDFLVARNGREMTEHLKTILNEPAVADALRQHGLRTIHEHHTCAHRVDELLSIHAALEDRRAAA
jgi:spore maturation protein CgeB